MKIYHSVLVAAILLDRYGRHLLIFHDPARSDPRGLRLPVVLARRRAQCHIGAVILRGDGGWQLRVRQSHEAVEISQVLRILDIEGVDEVALEGMGDPLGVLLRQRLQVCNRLIDVLDRQLLGLPAVP